MKQGLVAATLSATLVAAPAAAATFTGDFTVSTRTQGRGLQVQSTGGGNLAFSLDNVGDVYTDDSLFRIWTDEPVLDISDWLTWPISVAFNFGGSTFTATGTTNARDIPSIAVGGVLAWDNGGIFEFTFADGRRLGVTLAAGAFNSGFYSHRPGRENGLDVSATFRLNAAGVPEPATWAMMIGGFGLIGGAMRRQRDAAPA